MLLFPLSAFLFLTQNKHSAPNEIGHHLRKEKILSCAKRIKVQNSYLHLSSEDNVIVTQRKESTNDRGKDIEDISSFYVYVRFSPLIGGPALFPIHSEILLLGYDGDGHNNPNPVTVADIHDQTETAVLHRIDFIPKDPTNPDVIMNLLSLKNVDGIVRYRKLVATDGESYSSSFESQEEVTEKVHEEEANKFLIRTNSAPIERIEKLLSSNYKSGAVSIVLPLGPIKAKSDINKENIDGDADNRMTMHIRTPISIADLIERKKGMELNLVRNNCYSFTFDVLQCINFFNNVN